MRLLRIDNPLRLGKKGAHDLHELVRFFYEREVSTLFKHYKVSLRNKRFVLERDTWIEDAVVSASQNECRYSELLQFAAKSIRPRSELNRTSKLGPAIAHATSILIGESSSFFAFSPL